MKGFRVNKVDYVLKQLTALPRAVLHVGCTDSPNTAARLEQGTLLHTAICDGLAGTECRVTGIDIDDSAIALLRTHMPSQVIINMDAHKLPQFFGDDAFDLIIAGDVIEHLPNPGIFLDSCSKVLKPKGRLILTTTNAYGVVRFAKSLLFHEAVHSEHTAYYSHKTVERLLELSGLRLIEKGYYACEPIRYFSINRLISNMIEIAACHVCPQWSEGLIVIAGRRIDGSGAASGQQSY